MSNRRAKSALAAAFLAAIMSSTALTPAHAQGAAPVARERDFLIEAQSLTTAILEFSRQTNAPVVAPASLTEGRSAPAVRGRMEEQTALAMLLEGTGLSAVRGPTGGWAVTVSPDPQSGSAVGDGAEVEALIVTAQKREEDIQDVPIAISAFTQEALEEQKIEGGFDLLKAIPNVTFSKNNFTSYNFSIRGVGTKAISATTDPGVAVAFNNMTLIQNRLFEQEYFDVDRVEVLRGPQGTLYGRNATSGVINVISKRADPGKFEGWLKGEVGNYNTKRLSAMVNVPVVQGVLAVRFAGAATVRDGYDYNSITRNDVNGRDLWSGRLSVGFEPTDRLRVNVLWERFEENDNRSRTGKQLCRHDPGPEFVGGQGTEQNPYMGPLTRALFSQGCMPVNLYDDRAFETPNGLALPFVFGMLALQSDCGPGCSALYAPGVTEPPYDNGFLNPNARAVTMLSMTDPFGGQRQSTDLRTIASLRDPIYRAKADVLALDLEFDLSDSLRIVSQTIYNKDRVYSFQDYNRFNTLPIFNDSSGWYGWAFADIYNNQPSPWRILSPGGIFCDPQIGCSNTMVTLDISSAKGQQFSQELRLASDFDGPLNFSVGAHYTRFSTVIDYYVFNNVLTAFARTGPFNAQPDPTLCNFAAGIPALLDPPVPIGSPDAGCPYIDPNPIESIDGDGHNYFRSKNPYRLKSAAAFGEVYWQATEAVKVTAGLRYTDDRKSFTPVPSQVLLGSTLFAAGTVSRGYPSEPDINQQWQEVTGRFGVDWQPELQFTEQTLLYAFYSHGYKGGGANPPSIGFAKENPISPNLPPVVSNPAINYGPTFDPEYVDAIELGAKNTLLGGAMILNAAAFYYDYQGYQVSKIVDRTSVNENFDATTWGIELESVFRPNKSLRINASLGYLDTKIADGEKSIDIMNRTQSNPDWVIVKPWVQLPSNCIVPVSIAEQWLDENDGATGGWFNFCGGWGIFGSSVPYIDPNTGAPYTHVAYPEINGGAGFYDDLSGNELPNAPHWTVSLGAQYEWDLLEGWTATVRGDAYWQSQSWARVYNSDPYDKLHGWYNVNLSLWLERPEDDLKIELYVKNALDKTPITDSFLNSDDTALTTNVFVLDPRLIGLSIRKGF